MLWRIVELSGPIIYTDSVYIIFQGVVLPLDYQQAQPVQPDQHPPAYPSGGNAAKQAPVVSVSDWLITILIMAIPIVNIIMMFIWAFSPETNPSKANYFKASLIWAAIGIGISILFLILFVTVFASMVSTL